MTHNTIYPTSWTYNDTSNCWEHYLKDFGQNADISLNVAAGSTESIMVISHYNISACYDGNEWVVTCSNKPNFDVKVTIES